MSEAAGIHIAFWLPIIDEATTFLTKVLLVDHEPHGSERPPRGRVRWLLPLPALAVPVNGRLAPQESSAARFANTCIHGLNSLCGATQSLLAPSLAQRTAHMSIFTRVLDFFQQLGRSRPRQGADALASLIGDDQTPKGRLQADAFDLLDRSALVDAVACLSPEEQRLVCSSEDLFMGAPPLRPHFPGIAPADYEEYGKLVARQIRSGKVTLSFDAAAGGTVFAVTKTGSDKLREVWHGEFVSSRAVAPPCPPHLLNPASLLGLHASWDAPLVLSKKDGRCLFDQLRVPVQLQRFLARPPTRVSYIVKAGLLSLADLRAFFPSCRGLSLGSQVFPLSRVWPVGLSWSSYVAQRNMEKVCRMGGVSFTHAACGRFAPTQG